MITKYLTQGWNSFLYKVIKQKFAVSLIRVLKFTIGFKPKNNFFSNFYSVDKKRRKKMHSGMK